MKLHEIASYIHIDKWWTKSYLEIAVYRFKVVKIKDESTSQIRN